jgi:hypothetical protein
LGEVEGDRNLGELISQGIREEDFFLGFITI